MKYYKNTITGAISYTIPIDFNVRGLWQTYDDGKTSGSNTSSASSSGSKSNWGDTFGAVVSSLTQSFPIIWSAVTGKTPISQPQVSTAAGSVGSAPAGGSGSGSAGAGQNNGSSFNWTTLLLPVIGIVVIVLLITKK